MSLNDYDGDTRASRHLGARDKKYMTDLTAKIVEEAGIRPIDGPVDICIRWIESTRRRDWNNVTFAKKGILDGIEKAKVIRKDSQKYIPMPNIDLGDFDRTNPRIEVYIRPWRKTNRFQGWEEDLTWELGFNPFNQEE